MTAIAYTHTKKLKLKIALNIVYIIKKNSNTPVMIEGTYKKKQQSRMGDISQNKRIKNGTKIVKIYTMETIECGIK